MIKTHKAFPAFILWGLLIFIGTSIQGQDSWASFSQNVNTKGYEGRRFRLSGLVRAEMVDDSAAAHLWARVDKEQGTGFFDNMEKRPIRNREWKEYTIDGTIDSTARQIAFGVFCLYNGNFYFDNLTLAIETQKGTWTNVFAEDFESGTHTLVQGVQGGTRGINTLFKSEVIRDKNARGSKSLLVTGTNVPIYGLNNKVGKFADVNGIRLYYEVYGEGQPLLVLHGNGGSIADASSFYADLMKKYKVIAVDSRAQGKSTDTDKELTYDLMASDVNALLEQLKIDSVNIWGQSDGAILGLILAMDYPKKVKRVLAFGANIQPDSLALFPWVLSSMQKVMSESKDPKERKLNQLMLKYPNIPFSNLSRIKAPVLIMAGDRDAIRPEHTLKLFQSIPNSHLSIVPGATHGASLGKKHLFFDNDGGLFHQTFYDAGYKRLVPMKINYIVFEGLT